MDLSTKTVSLSEKIATTDNEINQLVYKLYDLTDEEIAVVARKITGKKNRKCPKSFIMLNLVQHLQYILRKDSETSS